MITIRVAYEILTLRNRYHELRQRTADLERKVDDLERLADLVPRLQEAVEQLHDVLENRDVPAPVFLRWHYTEKDGLTTASAWFGAYRLEVVNGSSAVTWSIRRGNRWLAAGGGHTLFDLALDEAQETLREIILSRQTVKNK